MRIENSKNNVFVCDAEVARTLKERSTGLLGRTELKDGEGMLITKCHSVHSFGMKFEFSAIFLDKNNRVVKVIDNFKKNRMSKYYISCKNVLELPAFRSEKTDIKKGDILNFID